MGEVVQRRGCYSSEDHEGFRGDAWAGLLEEVRYCTGDSSIAGKG